MAYINTWELEFNPGTASYPGYAHRRSSKTSDEVLVATDAITSLAMHVIGGMGLRRPPLEKGALDKNYFSVYADTAWYKVLISCRCTRHVHARHGSA